MPVFPSNEWFQAVRERYNGDASLHSGGGGACDTRAGFKIGDRIFLVVFEGLECAEVGEVDASELASMDFYLDMPEARWIDMVHNIQENGAADRDHTLNTLDLELAEADGLAHTAGGDQYKTDLFYRYNQNFQDFFDASAGIETRFED